MATPTRAHPSAAANRLRGAIDSGRTGDKIAWPDPAAAPLGTDDEAGGTPPSAWTAEAALAHETHRPHAPDQPGRGVGMAWWTIIFVLIVAILVGWAVLSR